MKSDRRGHKTMPNRVRPLDGTGDTDRLPEEGKLEGILRQGAEAWNAWRVCNPDHKIDLSWIHIEGINLSGANLRKAVLDNACLRKVDLTRANLQGASLRNTDLRFADLRKSELDNADFTGARLSGAIPPEGIKLPSIGTGIIEKA